MRRRSQLAQLVGSLLVAAGCGRVGFDATAPPDGPAAGPIARYLFDDDPADGIDDATGNGHDGTCAACPVRVPGVDASAYQFDGTTLIRIPYQPSLSPLGGVSVALWVRIDAGVGCIVGKPVGSGVGNSWQLCSFLSGLTACTGTTGTTCMSVDPEPRYRTWYQLTLTHDGTTLRAWSRGALLIELASTMAADDSDILIGGDLDGGAPAALIMAAIDDVRIWDRALSPAEVADVLSPY